MITIQKMYDEVSNYLSKNLSSNLTYHNVAHTQYVYEKARIIADKEDISKSDLFLLQTAALFHDIGFVQTHVDHEKLGCEIAEIWLIKYGFDRSDRQLIHGMIMATKIPQEPKNNLECILADADLIYLGTPLFEKQSANLYQELLHFYPNLSVQEWNDIQISFISKHHYHTNYCNHYYEHRKLKKLQLLIDTVG